MRSSKRDPGVTYALRLYDRLYTVQRKVSDRLDTDPVTYLKWAALTRRLHWWLSTATPKQQDAYRKGVAQRVEWRG